jgi:hypothetical protein
VDQQGEHLLDLLAVQKHKMAWNAGASLQLPKGMAAWSPFYLIHIMSSLIGRRSQVLKLGVVRVRVTFSHSWQEDRPRESYIEHVTIIIGQWSMMCLITLRLRRGKCGVKRLGRRKPLEMHLTGPSMNKR